MSVFEELISHKLFMVSLWEIKTGLWRCCLRDNESNINSNILGPCDGKTAEEAIRKAMVYGKSSKFDLEDLI